MNDIKDFENLIDPQALRREQKKKPKMRKHGQVLKKSTLRPILHMHKVKSKKRR